MNSRASLVDGIYLLQAHSKCRLLAQMRSADRIGGRSGAERGIAVTIELAAPADRLAVFVRATGLSPRETELVGLVVDGLDGKEVAARMFLSPHTVQDHLKSVFAKTSTRSRRELVAMVRGG